MSTVGDQDTLSTVIRQTRIIVAALIGGVLIFIAIAFLVDLRPGRQAGMPAEAGAGAGANANVLVGERFALTDLLITTMAVIFAAVCVPMSFVVPNLVAARNRQFISRPPTGAALPNGQTMAATPAWVSPTETGKLAWSYLSTLIVGAALVEGSAIFAAIAYMIEKSPIALGLALLLVAVLILRFPTEGGLERWIEQQRSKLADERLRERSG
jgi:hypothetical protein